MQKFYNSIDPAILDMYEAERADRMGATDADGGTVVSMYINDSADPDEPVVREEREKREREKTNELNKQ